MDSVLYYCVPSFIVGGFLSKRLKGTIVVLFYLKWLVYLCLQVSLTERLGFRGTYCQFTSDTNRPTQLFNQRVLEPFTRAPVHEVYNLLDCNPNKTKKKKKWEDGWYQ